jgi:hypothetical protein
MVISLTKSPNGERRARACELAADLRGRTDDGVVI